MSGLNLRVDKDGHPLGLTFWYPFSLKDFEDDWGALIDNLNEWVDKVNESRQNLRQGEPDCTTYKDWADNPTYQSDLRIWENTVAQNQVIEAHKPPPQFPPSDRDFLALSSPHAGDKEKAKWNLDHRDFVKKQFEEAERLEGLGEPTRAATARERATMVVREIESRRKSHPYQFEIEDDQRLLEDANQKLEWASKNLTDEQLRENLPYYQSLIESRNRECNEENSYTIDTRSEKLRIRNVTHAGSTARELSQLPEDGERTIAAELAGIPEEGSPPMKEEESNPDDPWESQAAYEQWATERGMPQH